MKPNYFFKDIASFQFNLPSLLTSPLLPPTSTAKHELSQQERDYLFARKKEPGPDANVF